MLKELRIRNLAIIDDLAVGFGEGLNVLTGETGAGKSIIVDSLGLALGSRAQSDLVRSGEKEAVVQAYFEIEEKKGFPDIGVDLSEGLILRRDLSAAGKSRAYINDTMVSRQTLAEVGRALVDIHGQHEHQSLFSVDKHRDFLDAFGKLQDEQERLEALYQDVEALKRQVTDLGQKSKEREQRLDLLKFQVHEIDAASLSIGEKEKLSEQRAILSNLGRLNELAENAYSALYGAEGSCMERLSSIISKVKEMSSIDHSVSSVLNMLESAFPSIQDAAVSLRGYRDKYDFEPERLSGVEDRLDLIRKLEKKYGEGIENIIRYREDAEREMKGLEHIDEKLYASEADLNAKEVMLLDAAGSLSDKRKNAAQQMEPLIRKELEELAFSNAEFMIDIKKEAISSHGMDRVEFLFSANPGEPPKPLLKIASGGELSRVMLALKSILADFDSIPVLIFDEVDAGIGGKTAESVGKKLKAIANKHQVLCTTHLPQIASMGDCHLKTEKSQRGERVYVEVKELTGKERLNEVARMLSGKITEVSLKHAKELIESNV
ncbi:MAG: DNA repair protein RecN [Nitrospira sp.]|nr:DNA repair protein RecN [Nitrospira sp.]